MAPSWPFFRPLTNENTPLALFVKIDYHQNVMTKKNRDWRKALTARERKRLAAIEAQIKKRGEKIAELRTERRRIQNAATARASREGKAKADVGVVKKYRDICFWAC